MSCWPNYEGRVEEWEATVEEKSSFEVGQQHSLDSSLRHLSAASCKKPGIPHPLIIAESLSHTHTHRNSNSIPVHRHGAQKQTFSRKFLSQMAEKHGCCSMCMLFTSETEAKTWGDTELIFYNKGGIRKSRDGDLKNAKEFWGLLHHRITSVLPGRGCLCVSPQKRVPSFHTNPSRPQRQAAMPSRGRVKAHEQREEAAQTEMADQYENKIHSALSLSSRDLVYLTYTLG